MSQAVPDVIPAQSSGDGLSPEVTKTRGDFVEDIKEGIKVAPMSIRLTPHVLSVIDWNNPYEDPVRRQFIPVRSSLVPDHPSLSLDSLVEKAHSPVEGLVHRYPDKVLFLGKSTITVARDQADVLTFPSDISLSSLLPLLHTVLRSGK